MNYINTFQNLINNHQFLMNLLSFSNDDINVFINNIGKIFSYYIITNDTREIMSPEEIIILYDHINSKEFSSSASIDYLVNNCIFTHSCSGEDLEQIKMNGLGAPIEYDKDVSAALLFLESRANMNNSYVSIQSGRNDEVYFTSPGAPTFNYAIDCSPERLFYGILHQNPENALPIVVGESKKEYYRRVLYSKFDTTDDKVLYCIEKVLDGFFSKENGIVCFPVKSILDHDIYRILIRDSDRYHIKDSLSFIIDKCKDENGNFRIQNFFCQEKESDKNMNKLDNLIFINKVIPTELLSTITMPDRFDLLQMIAMKNGMSEISYFYSGLEENNKL